MIFGAGLWERSRSETSFGIRQRARQDPVLSSFDAVADVACRVSLLMLRMAQYTSDSDSDSDSDLAGFGRLSQEAKVP